MKCAARKSRKKPAEHLIQILAASTSPAEMLELYYWSKEPGLAEVIRHIAAMPEGTRAAIEAFIALARDAKSVSADLDACGVLTLRSGEAARAIALAHYAAAEDDDLSRLPH
jgi:hypothetical protein